MGYQLEESNIVNKAEVSATPTINTNTKMAKLWAAAHKWIHNTTIVRFARF